MNKTQKKTGKVKSRWKGSRNQAQNVKENREKKKQNLKENRETKTKSQRAQSIVKTIK